MRYNCFPIRQTVGALAMLFLQNCLCPFLWAASDESSLRFVDQIFAQSEDLSGTTGFCFSADLGDVPPSVVGLKKILENGTGKTTDEIRFEFARFSDKAKNLSSEIDEQSSYLKSVKKLPDPSVFHGQEKLSVYLGLSSNNVRLIKDIRIRSYFERQFKAIASKAVSWNPTRLSRSDLFHAHVTYNSIKKDLFVVFHGKEYILGEPSVALGYPRRKFLDFIGDSVRSDLSLLHPTPAVTRRNFVWSFRANRICGLDTTHPNTLSMSVANEDPSLSEGDSLTEGDLASERAFAEKEAGRCTLDQDKLSDLGEHGEIADIYYFPTESVPLFMAFQRGIGSGDKK